MNESLEDVRLRFKKLIIKKESIESYLELEVSERLKRSI